MSKLPGFAVPPIWEFDKHDGRLVAGEREFMGRRFFEVRLWAGENNDRATRKGVTLPLGAVPDLARALVIYAGLTAPSEPKDGN